MALFHIPAEIPPNTTRENPHIIREAVNVGIVSQLEIYYPKNLNRLAGFWIENRGVRTIPKIGILTGNQNTSVFYDVAFFEAPEILIKCFNLDPKFTHTIDIWINVISEG